MRGFTQETTTAFLTTIDNTECMKNATKYLVTYVASKVDDAESSFSMHGEISTYQEWRNSAWI